MAAVCLIDTSVFCELLDIPGKASEPARFKREFEQRIDGHETFLLPLATIIETGNHIGQQRDGRLRRQAAQRFKTVILSALDGQAPFTPTQLSVEDLVEWIDKFPEWATRGSGLGDLSIREEWERLRTAYPARHVYVWSKDEHLSALVSQ